MPVKYDTIGQGYNNTRQADPYLSLRLAQFLIPQPGHRYVDIGCGTGNYTRKMAEIGGEWRGIDPSEKMLDIARNRAPEIKWERGKAEDMALGSESLDGVLATLTLHHWSSLSQGFGELARVMKPGAGLVIFTSSPWQMRGYWLNHYFPQMLSDSIEQMPALSQVIPAMEENGLEVLNLEKYFVLDDLQDHFLYCGKYRPQLYLDPSIQRGISSFSSLALQEEVEQGIIRLKADIENGHIQELIEQYDNTWGDYLFIQAQKPN